MGQTTSSVEWRCCRSSTLPRPDKSQDTISIGPIAESAETYPFAQSPIAQSSIAGCSSCTVFKGQSLDTALKKPAAPASARVVDDDCLPCPSVVVTNVLPTAATVLWSCATAQPSQKLYLEVLLDESIEQSSIASFVVDGTEESFEMPAGTLQRAHGPYYVKVVAEAESMGVQRLSNPGQSATFFTEPEPPGVVSDLRFSSSGSKSASGLEIVLEWKPPYDDGGSRIHEYEVSICPKAGPSRTFSTRECNARVSDLEAKGTWPVRAEVRARSAGGMLGRLSHMEIQEPDWPSPRPSASCSIDSPTPRARSMDEPSAEPPTRRDVQSAQAPTRLDVQQQAASPWLGAGWENAFVVKASAAFEPSGDNSSTMVRVRPGDSIQVLEQHTTGWTYCKNLSLETQVPVNSSIAVSGWVPDWVVKVKKPRSTSSKRKPKETIHELAGGAQGAALAA